MTVAGRTAERAASDEGASSRAGRWRIWVDTGGTFTDCIGIRPDGTRCAVKVLSSSAMRMKVDAVERTRVRVLTTQAVPDAFFTRSEIDFGSGRRARIESSTSDGWLTLDRPISDLLAATDRPPTDRLPTDRPPTDQTAVVEVRFDLEAPVLAAHLLTATPPDARLPPMALRLATTRGTNALLERKGRPPAFFVTRGFGDLLRIGDQRRPDLFALEIKKPPVLHGPVVEVEERIGADGEIVAPLDGDALERAIARIDRDGVTNAAVALINSYANPVHEEAVAAALRAAGFDHVSTSASLSPSIKILPRAETAVVDAYLAPIVDAYLRRVRAAIEVGDERGDERDRGTLHVMTSAGGLVPVASYRPKDSLLSGPAGGVVGAAAAGRASGFERLIAFDMGGTSTDVSRIAGDLTYRFEHRVGDATVAAPALEIETVAAGGGSVCWADGERLRVGPQSAGADPGPACYGAGGPLTVTDVNLLLGRLDPFYFGIPVDPEAARGAFESLRSELGAAGDGDALLAGALAIANERMADAIRRISVRRGYDPADHALVAFGGAGGQHACAVAERLGIRSVILPPDAGLLSAVGLGAAVIERFASRQVLERLDAVAGQLGAWARGLSDDALEDLASEGVQPSECILRRVIVELRLLGQEASLEIEVAAVSDLEAPSRSSLQAGFESGLEILFKARYEAVFGYPPPDRPLEVVALRVVASERPVPESVRDPAPTPAAAEPIGRRHAYLGDTWQDVDTYRLEDLEPGDQFAGPALVFDAHATLVVESGWRAQMVDSGAMVLKRSESGSAAR